MLLNPFHLAITVDDLDQARAFYGGVMGCAKILGFEMNGVYMGWLNRRKKSMTPQKMRRLMNWYGPYNGAYFSKLIKEIIKKNEKY